MKTNSLEIVSIVFQMVSENIDDPQDDTPREFKIVTLPGGIVSFRFNQVVEVNGDRYEVQVRKLG